MFNIGREKGRNGEKGEGGDSEKTIGIQADMYIPLRKKAFSRDL